MYAGGGVGIGGIYNSGFIYFEINNCINVIYYQICQSFKNIFIIETWQILHILSL